MRDLIHVIFLTQKLISVALIFQTIELLTLKSSYADKGVWRWSSLAEEFKIFSPSTQKVLSFCLRYRNFLFILGLRLALSFTLIFYSNSFILLLLLFSTILISLRWRGTFNGGSDYMTVIIL